MPPSAREVAQLGGEAVGQAGQGEQVVAHRLERDAGGVDRRRDGAGDDERRHAGGLRPDRRERGTGLRAGAGCRPGPAGSGGRASPAAAAACAAFAAEKVKVALTWPADLVGRVAGHAPGSVGHLGDGETGASAAAAGVGHLLRAAARCVNATSPYAERSGSCDEVGRGTSIGATCSVRKIGSQSLAAATPAPVEERRRR